MKKILVISAALASTMLVATAHAQNLLTNGSFETGTFTDNGADSQSLAIGSTAMTGWTVVNAEVAWLGQNNPYGLTPQDGSFSLDLTGYHDSSPYGGVEQTFATTAGGKYSLSFYVGVQNGNGSYSAPNSVTASIDGNSSLQSFTNSYSGAGENWQLFTVNFTAPTASTTLDIIGQSSHGGQYIGLDNVSVQAAPEPTPVIFLLFGTVGIVALRYRKA